MSTQARATPQAEPIPQSALDRAAEREWRDAWLAGPDPARLRWSALPPQRGDAAPDLALPDQTGRPRRLSEFWSKQPVLLLFLRHFGCSCLAERWERLQAELTRLQAAGATVVGICQADPQRAAEVATRRGYPFPLLCDPQRGAYERYGVLEGSPAQVLHDFAWQPGDDETADALIGERQGTERAMVDNPWQLPAEFVIAPGGAIVHAHRYQYCEDFPPVTVLLGALAAAERLGPPASGMRAG